MADNLLNYPRLFSIDDPDGCSLTKVSSQALTPDKIVDMGMIEYNHEALFARMMESRAVGVVPNTLHDLLTSRIATVSKKQLAQRSIGRDFIAAPFKYRRRKRNAAVSYFNVAAGAAAAGAGDTLHSSAWRLTVDIGPGEFATRFKNLARYFLPGNHIIVEHKNAATGVSYTTYHKIIDSEDHTAEQAYVIVSAPFTEAGWDELTEGDKAKYQPTSGAIQLLTNNVSDYESWCYNQPVNNPNELIVDWFGTSRFTRARTKEYEEMLARILSGEVNQYAARFKYLPAAERNRLEFQAYNQQWMNAVFYNQRINEHQTENPTWDDIESLEQVVDPEDPTCVLEYKANPLGIHTQLAENNRILDAAGGQLDLDLIAEMGYTLKRNRAIDGKSHDVVDVMTDRITAHQIEQVMIDYYKKTYGYEVTRFIEQGKVLDHTNIVVFNYKIFDIPQHHFRLAVFTHPFFDDRLSAFGDGSGGLNGSVDNKSRGRWLMGFDWDDLTIGVVETNSVRREYKGETTANANSTWSCVMKLNTKTYDLQSTTWDVEIGDFERHLLVENFSGACPKITVSMCTAGSGDGSESAA